MKIKEKFSEKITGGQYQSGYKNGAELRFEFDFTEAKCNERQIGHMNLPEFQFDFSHTTMQAFDDYGLPYGYLDKNSSEIVRKAMLQTAK